MIIRPYVSEKSYSLTKFGLYTFEVSTDVTKQQIAKLVKDRFSVDVLSVKTITIPAKRRLQRARRRYYSVGGLRKAMVQVKKGQKILIFEQINEEPKEEVVVTTAEGEPIATEVKEKKSLLGGTKVKIEKGVSDAETQNRDQETVQLIKKRQGNKKGDS